MLSRRSRISTGRLHTRPVAFARRVQASRPAAAARHPRPPAPGVRPPGPARSPRPGGRAGAHRALPEHERPQPRRGLRRPARALPPWRGRARGRRWTRWRTAIRPGGLAPTKAVRIGEILDTRVGDDDLGWIADAPLEEARDYLWTCRAWAARRRPACCSSPSAATTCRSTRTCYRVGTRLGLFRPRASFDEAHDEMLRLARRRASPTRCTCCSSATGGGPARRALPRCGECPLRRMCPTTAVASSRSGRSGPGPACRRRAPAG